MTAQEFPRLGIGIILIVGSLAFLTAAFMPVSRLFGERSGEKKLAIIQADRAGWTISQVLFGLGAAVTWAGLVWLAYEIWAVRGSVIALAAAAPAGIGAGLWIIHVYQRAVRPQAFTNNEMPAWPFIVYSILTQLALIGLGISLLRAVVPGWIPLLNIAAGLLTGLAFLIFKDVPPLLYYAVTLATGIGLVLLPSI